MMRLRSRLCFSFTSCGLFELVPPLPEFRDHRFLQCRIYFSRENLTLERDTDLLFVLHTHSAKLLF
jgi:hypothetical protein